MFPRAEVWWSALLGAMVGGLITILFLKLSENIEEEVTERGPGDLNNQPRDKKQPQEHDERFCREGENAFFTYLIREIEGPIIYFRSQNFHQSVGNSIIRELKQTTTATATRTSPNKRLNEQNNSSARAFEVLVHFLAVLCKTTT